MTLTPRTLGQRLRLKRTLRGWTLRELGERSGGVSFSHICEIETGKVREKGISLDVIEALARTLRCKPAWLAGWK